MAAGKLPLFVRAIDAKLDGGQIDRGGGLLSATAVRCRKLSPGCLCIDAQLPNHLFDFAGSFSCSFKPVMLQREFQKQTMPFNFQLFSLPAADKVSIPSQIKGHMLQTGYEEY